MAYTCLFLSQKTMPKEVKPKKSAAPAKAAQAAKGSLFEKRSRSFAIGNDIQPKRDVGRFVRWPKYVRLQRQKAVLLKRLKVPPAINQFSQTLDKVGFGRSVLFFFFC
jgi:large subunit ribosomal protein L7Ae